MSTFITLPKKPSTTKYELYSTISMPSHHLAKPLLRVLLDRLRESTTGEVTEGPDGFTPDKATRNAAFVLNVLAKLAVKCRRISTCVSLIV